jgi:hypothetical protein
VLVLRIEQMVKNLAVVDACRRYGVPRYAVMVNVNTDTILVSIVIDIVLLTH